MQVLHITPKTHGYEIVTLVANAVDRTNSMAVIQKDGEVFMTGGLIFHDTLEIRSIFDSFPPLEHYIIGVMLKEKPYCEKMFWVDISLT